MNKIILTIGLALFTITGAFAQLESPVTWSYAAKKINATSAELYIKATIDEGWHLYSQFLKPGGPNKTTIAFTPSKDFALVGTTTEPKPITYFDKTFKMDVSYFADQVVFRQKIKLNANSTVVKGKIEFMVCDDSRCLPPDEVAFSIPVK